LGVDLWKSYPTFIWWVGDGSCRCGEKQILRCAQDDNPKKDGQDQQCSKLLRFAAVADGELVGGVGGVEVGYQAEAGGQGCRG
jgi:hypothetical protein